MIGSLTFGNLALCGLILVVAYGLRGGTGFGTAVVMPFLALIVPMKVLVPAWTMLGIASSTIILAREHRHVAVNAFVQILPPAYWEFASASICSRSSNPVISNEDLAVSFWPTESIPSSPWPAEAAPSRHRFVAAIAGVLARGVGTLFGTMASVPFAAYLDARRLNKDQYRATMSAMLLALSVVRGPGYLAIGALQAEIWVLVTAALPMMLLGLYLGDTIHNGLSEKMFRRLISILLIAIALPLIFL